MAPVKIVAPRPSLLAPCFVVKWEYEGVRGWGLINGLVLKEESAVVAGDIVAKTTELGLLLVPAGLKVKITCMYFVFLQF